MDKSLFARLMAVLAVPLSIAWMLWRFDPVALLDAFAVAVLIVAAALWVIRWLMNKKVITMVK